MGLGNWFCWLNLWGHSCVFGPHSNTLYLIRLFSSLVLPGGLLPAGGHAAAAQLALSFYHTWFVADAPVTLGLGAISIFGLYWVRQKHGLSEAELLALRKDDAPRTTGLCPAITAAGPRPPATTSTTARCWRYPACWRRTPLPAAATAK